MGFPTYKRVELRIKASNYMKLFLKLPLNFKLPKQSKIHPGKAMSKCIIDRLD